MTPSAIDGGDPSPGEYGFKFQAATNGYITGIRFFKSAANTGAHVGHLWNSSGTPLASVTFANESTSGWQQASFTSPVAVAAGTTYVASYFAPNGHYSFNPGFFSTSLSNGPLLALADGADGPNGVYEYSATGAFPASTWNASNYWVDVVFSETDTPAVTAHTPLDGAIGTSLTPLITATFSEAMDPSTINGNTIQILDGANNPLGATITYDAATHTASLQPLAALFNSTTYTVVVRGGALDPVVRNIGGTALPTNASWSFTTVAAVPVAVCPCSLWSATAVPTVPDSGDGSAGEYGVRIQSSANGFITGIRFYKSVANTGTHIGSLWDNTGNLLASATFVSESASGWQQVTFSTPVPVTAGTTYVASYYTPSGHYSFSGGFFSTSLLNAPLTALADGTSGANGVFAYSAASVFPTLTWNSSNYWVDVVFNTTNVPNVTAFAPIAGATGVATTTSLTATFSVAMDPTTVNSTTFQLLDSSNTVVSASVSYDIVTRTATLQPLSALSNSTAYTALVRGGVTEPTMKSESGTPLVANTSWSFTTAASQSSSGGCPCSIWGANSVPVNPDSKEALGIEVGVKFRTDTTGLITGIRFYKSAANTGTHIGNLWTSTGTLLGTATFTNETSAGWQQVSFGTPVVVSQGVTYIASYYAPVGHYAYDPNTLTGSGVNNAPLHALASGVDGGNGVFVYGAASAFPNSSFNASNYWVDVVYSSGSSTIAPAVTRTTPAGGATGSSLGGAISVTFSEPMDASTITAANFQLVDGSGAPVTGTVSYSSVSASLVFQPDLGLSPLTAYTATVKGLVKDFFGNQMGADYSWSFVTAAPPSDIGPGGPILVISSTTNPFSRYYGEILLAEGMNEFLVQDITRVTAASLSGYDVAILGDMKLSADQVTMLSTWVNGGGNLIAMHPDAQLASLLGLATTSNTMSNGYLLVNTAASPGAGIVNQTIQFHGAADIYALNGATSIATLYSDASTATAYPAVAWRSVGAGKVAAFTYDLARSVVYTRQGNPAWSGQQRNTFIDPTAGNNSLEIRSDDLFYGNAPFDPEPDWVNLNKVAVPQADEQQRLLVNLINSMQMQKKPLPRFWYLPSGLSAAIIMTGDDHNNGGTVGRFQNYAGNSAPNCSVADWQCIRATSYMWPGVPITVAQATSFVSQGFELSFHPDSTPTCTNWTPSKLAGMYTTFLQTFQTSWPGLPAPATVRTHCITWSDYDTQPQVELSNGIRLDTNYYYWPDAWVQDRPGFFTGSGMPMRFADHSGNTIDVYQASTQLPDETTWTWPNDIDVLLDNAIGPLGFYGVFTANMHTDYVSSPGSDAIIAAAQARGIPIVSSVQMLTWLDGRNSSTFSNLSWSGSTLGFTITAGNGSRNLQAMLPVNSTAGTLSSISLNGTPIAFTMQTVKGVQYAIFSASSAAFTAVYGGGGSYSISGTIGGTAFPSATVALAGNRISTTTVNASGAYNFAGLPNGSYTLTPSSPGYVFTPASQSVTINGSNVTGANFTAAQVQLQSVVVSPATVVGGTGTAVGTITLSGPAPLSGVVLSISSSDSSAATVPGNVQIPALASTATFNINTSAVSAATTVHIQVSYNATNEIILAELIVTPAQVQSVSLSPSTVNGGGTSTGTVTLSASAAAAGALVTLSSSNSSVASVPSSVTISSGATSATFTVTSQAVSAVSVATISATFGATATAQLTVNPPALSSVAVNPQSVAGGTSATGTVTLSGPAPSGGFSVTLQDNSSTTSVPASVTVAAGATTATFTVGTVGVSATTVSTITASKNGVSLTATLTVTPPAIQSLTLSPTSVIGGIGNSTGTITLSGTAPTGGLTVALASSNGSAASVPATVTVAANATTATFTVTSHSVAASTNASITATFNGQSSASLTVDPLQAQSVTVSPATVVGGRSNATGTITLNAPAPSGGVLVALSSSNTSAATVPASVTVAANAQTATFTVTSRAVSATTAVTVTGVYNATVTASLTVSPLAIASITLNPTSVVGGSGSTGTVTLNASAPFGGAVVALQDNSSATTVPASVTVTSGSTTATFAITSTPVSSNASVLVTGSYGTSNASASLTVTAPQVQSVSLSPTSVTGGTGSTGTVRLTGAAPTGGSLVTLASSTTTAAQVPGTVTVPSGSTTATFPITTTPVSAGTVALITGTYGTSNGSASLTVTAPQAQSVSLLPTSVNGGTGSTGTVQLNGPAPTGGFSVTLTSSRTAAAQVPASVTVPSGSTTAGFSITTSAVSSSTSATITAGGSASATLTVLAPTLTSLTVNPTSVKGGVNSTGTVTLTSPAPAGGASVTLSSNNTSVGTVPSSVTVPAGTTSATFTVTTRTVLLFSRSVVITGTYNVQKTAILTVTP